LTRMKKVWVIGFKMTYSFSNNSIGRLERKSKSELSVPKANEFLDKEMMLHSLISLWAGRI
jgi:hypothetical protein